MLKLVAKANAQAPRQVRSTKVKSISGTQYELLAEIGRGGQGIVFYARRVHDRMACALKLPLPGDPATASLLRHEAAILAGFDHPHIVHLVESGETTWGLPFLAIEFLKGKTLSQLLQEKRHLSLTDSVEICRQLALALHYVHTKGVVHRDVKPENVFISQVNGQTFVQLADFSIASRGEASSTNLGSLYYLSPEQLVGDASTPGSDIYQLGLILYRLLTGKLPFALSMQDSFLYRFGGQILPDRQVFKEGLYNSGVDSLLQSILEAALARNSCDRQKSARMFAEDLSLILKRIINAA